eukprot:GHUV01036932.1.p1 GENE.GHUV01036932.1~~GHUV01036932.1.p1  ORF type:complete len:117 (-),score=11.77 GHUV01036932.1:191-541(-)
MQKPPRDPDEQLITPWVFVRYMVVGAYVGCATVGAFVVWYMFDNFMGIDLSKVRRVGVLLCCVMSPVVSYITWCCGSDFGKVSELFASCSLSTAAIRHQDNLVTNNWLHLRLARPR